MTTDDKRDLVLVGGGHSHVHVLKAFGLARRSGAAPAVAVALTLVARDVATPYSGMLPGHIAGLYSHDECHVDLARLCRFAGAKLIHAAATGLDVARNRVLMGDAALPYHALSLDIGSTARLETPGVAEHALTVRPVDRFLERWAASLDAARAGRVRRVLIAGGGVAGVELLLSMQARLAALGARPAFTLVVGDGLLPHASPAARKLLTRVLAERNAQVLRGHVARVDASGADLADGRRRDAEIVVWATGAAAAPWLRDTGLALDERGFVAVDACLRSVSHRNVFAAGDVAAVLPHPREKAGVYAVRQGPPLAENLQRFLDGAPLKPFDPQPRALALIGEGDGSAIALLGPFAARGRWLWRLKDWIDRRWMADYRDLPDTAPVD